VAEYLGPERDRSGNGPRVGIEEQLGRVAAQALRRVPGPADPVPVCLARPDSGQIRLNGKPWAETGARTIREAGIETVFQNLALVPTLSIVENMYLGRELYGPGMLAALARRIDKRRMRREVEAAFARLGLNMPPVTSKAGALSGGQRQAVAVARAVLWGSRVVIMDEPAAALGVQQTEAVLSLIGRLKAEGVATMLVSHNMEHVLRVADRVAVFRLGRKIADLDQREQPVTGMHLVGLITGATLTANGGQYIT